MISEMIEGPLKMHGWTTLSTTARTAESIGPELTLLASKLGEIIPGRDRLPVEVIVPETTETARPGSLSSRFGLNPLPLHTDTAHWSVPCRYLLLGCVEPGPTPTPTFMLDSQDAELSADDRRACATEVFRIRNGRHSFYGSVIDENRPFIRLDPGCMEPMSPGGAAVLKSFALDRQEKRIRRHEWKRGDILVLDNWRILHARGVGAQTQRGRILMRAMIR